jgi:hypothetical protein
MPEAVAGSTAVQQKAPRQPQIHPLRKRPNRPRGYWKDEVRQLLRGLWEVLQGTWMSAERIEDVDDPETLIAIVHQGGRGRDSGLDVNKVYAEPATALEAVGLSE